MTPEPLFTGAYAGRDRVAALILAGYLCVLLVVQLFYIADPAYLHEQQRSLYGYHQIQDPTLFAGDYVTQVVRAVSHPYLYDGISYLWVSAGGDLVYLHRLLPLACWLAFLAGTAVAARELGDSLSVLGALGLAAVQPLYLGQIAGSSPHAFAFPLLIWGVVALLHGSARGLMLVTVLSGLLYVAMVPLLGLLLAWQALVMGRFLQLSNLERAKVLLPLAAIGLLSLWMVLSALAPDRSLGTPLEPLQQVEVYPENGPEGAYFLGVSNPLLYVAGRALAQFRIPGTMLAAAVLLLCCLFAAYGLLSLPKGRGARKALLGFVLCSVVAGLTICLLKPYFTYRFILYPLFTILPLLTVIGLQRFCRCRSALARFSGVATAALLLPLFLAFDSFAPEKLGYATHIDGDDQRIVDFAAAQPPETMFAVWPGGDVELDFIPYLARRPVFVMFRAHFPTHDRHILKMRERMNALTDAYLATEAAPLRALHCRWGVDYLIVERAHFAPGGQRPDYFAPFDARIAEIWAGHGREDFLLSAPDPAAVVLETTAYRVIDLAAFPGAACGGAEVD